ncbi:hypothetical protein H7H51_12375, partial [Mycolicibacterium farcinogenes]|nr:hypothetical protein [Mycolicibacterium farcinogenes]
MAVALLDAARRRIASADSEHSLVTAAGEAHEAVRAVIEARPGAASVAAAWSAVACTALTTATRLVTTGDSHWYASGSVGRGDALPGSDLETLVVRGPGVTPESALSEAVDVHDLLAQCGFPADDNGAVASRVRFSRTAQDWAIGIGRWACDPEADRGVVMIGLLADAVPVSAASTAARPARAGRDRGLGRRGARDGVLGSAGYLVLPGSPHPTHQTG